MDLLTWLQGWFFAQCDGDWEHEFGVEITTLDNPGWRVVIDLSGTDLDAAPFSAADSRRSEHDWFHCEVADKKFKIACGPTSLADALDVFRTWADAQSFERRKQRRLGG